mgnify:CR=1 FL=1
MKSFYDRCEDYAEQDEAGFRLQRREGRNQFGSEYKLDDEEGQHQQSRNAFG